MTDPHDEHSSRTFGDRLSHLIETVHPPDRGPYSYRELSRYIQDATGVTMSATHLNQLAMDKRLEPKRSHIQALATFFGVPAGYFFDDAVANQVDEDLGAVMAWRDDETRTIAQRALRLSPDQRAIVSDLISSLDQYKTNPAENRRRRKRDQ